MIRNGWSLSNQFQQLRREVDDLLGSVGLAVPSLPGLTAPVFPAANVWDAGDALCVEAELPGVKMEELEVYAVGNELTLKGRRPAPTDERIAYHRRERGTGDFSRVLLLPVEVDADRVEATLKDGVLTIKLPKAEAAKPRRIALKAP